MNELVLDKENTVIGCKQTLRALRDGTAAMVVLADDADESVTAPVLELCRQNGVPVQKAQSMAQLGRAVGIEVGAAACAVLAGKAE